MQYRRCKGRLTKGCIRLDEARHGTMNRHGFGFGPTLTIKKEVTPTTPPHSIIYYIFCPAFPPPQQAFLSILSLPLPHLLPFVQQMYDKAPHHRQLTPDFYFSTSVTEESVTLRRDRGALIFPAFLLSILQDCLGFPSALLAVSLTCHSRDQKSTRDRQLHDDGGRAARVPRFRMVELAIRAWKAARGRRTDGIRMVVGLWESFWLLRGANDSEGSHTDFTTRRRSCASSPRSTPVLFHRNSGPRPRVLLVWPSTLWGGGRKV